MLCSALQWSRWRIDKGGFKGDEGGRRIEEGNSVLAGPGHGTAIGLPDPSLPSSCHLHHHHHDQVRQMMIRKDEDERLDGPPARSWSPEGPLDF